VRGRFLEPITTTVLLGIRLYRRENPFQPAVLAHWFRAFCQALLFTLLGVAAGGPSGGDFAFIGAVVLVGVDYTMSAVSDIPMRDRLDGTYTRLRGGPLTPVVTFGLRSLPAMAAGCIVCVVAAVTVGLATGRINQAAALAPSIPLLLPALLGAASLGLFVIAPTIGTRYDALAYNTVTVLLVLLTGALIPRGAHGAFDALGSLLPMTNALEGVRSMMAGGSASPAFAREALVAGGWAVVAAATYAVMDRRGLQTGRGGFEN